MQINLGLTHLKSHKITVLWKYAPILCKTKITQLISMQSFLMGGLTMDKMQCISEIIFKTISHRYH